jgi:hypothetical protein
MQNILQHGVALCYAVKTFLSGKNYSLALKFLNFKWILKLVHHSGIPAELRRVNTLVQGSDQ